MPAHHPENERTKRKYLTFLKESKGQNEATLDAVAAALARFEAHTKHRAFKAFHYEQAIAFKRHLADARSKRSDGVLSKATQHATLRHLKDFFRWLSHEPGHRARMKYTDAEYFSLSEKDARIAMAARPIRWPSLEEINRVIATMPSSTELEMRNRALVAFTILTGARDRAIASMKLKHLDIAGGYINQDAREVKTKFSKSFKTYFFPVNPLALGIVRDWKQFLVEQKKFGNDDPLFPATMVECGEDVRFSAVGLSRRHWTTTGPIRAVFKAAFAVAGAPYYYPHSFRHTLANLGERMCQRPEQFKAWSQNLGHEGVLTTLSSYGTVSEHRQGEIIQGFGVANASVTEPAMAALFEQFKDYIARHA
jgi:integrase/recombinase XerD